MSQQLMICSQCDGWRMVESEWNSDTQDYFMLSCWHTVSRPRSESVESANGIDLEYQSINRLERTTESNSQEPGYGGLEISSVVIDEISPSLEDEPRTESNLRLADPSIPEENEEPIETHMRCRICEKEVEIEEVRDTGTHAISRTYFLKCSHIVTVQFDVRPKVPDISRRDPVRTIDPSLTFGSGTLARFDTITEDDKTWKAMMPYQREGVKFGAKANFRFLLADDPGLGKTIQTIALLRYFPEETLPALVIAPATITPNWQREFKKWFSDKFPDSDYVPFIHKESLSGLISGQQIYIISSAMIGKPSLTNAIIKYGFKTLIIDESQQYKNPKSKRTKALFTLAAGIQNLILMSGTPIMNRVMEYWNSLNILRPRHWFHKRQLKYFCTFDSKGRPLAISQDKRPQFFATTKDYILRRTKEEVLPDLPKKFVKTEWISFASSKKLVDAYNRLTDELEEEMNTSEAGSMNDTIFGIIARLRNLVGTAKAYRIQQYIANMISTNGEKIAIGCHHVFGIKELQETLQYKICPKCNTLKFTEFTLDSEETDDEEESLDAEECLTCGCDLTSEKKHAPLKIQAEQPHVKQATIDEFQNDPNKRILIASILGCGVGLNLHFCPNVVVMEREWNYAIERQFEDRFHRFGLKHPVTISYLQAVDTIDEYFDETVELKKQISKSSMDEGYIADNTFLWELAQKCVAKRMKHVGA
jgi:SWI/SNF-related matrix-associated actin-dependent regulator of chromatin subfamily A-like protein 1